MHRLIAESVDYKIIENKFRLRVNNNDGNNSNNLRFLAPWAPDAGCGCGAIKELVCPNKTVENRRNSTGA
jgi:hypothetical protein